MAGRCWHCGPCSCAIVHVCLICLVVHQGTSASPGNRCSWIWAPWQSSWMRFAGFWHVSDGHVVSSTTVRSAYGACSQWGAGLGDVCQLPCAVTCLALAVAYCMLRRSETIQACLLPDGTASQLEPLGAATCSTPPDTHAHTRCTTCPEACSSALPSRADPPPSLHTPVPRTSGAEQRTLQDRKAPQDPQTLVPKAERDPRAGRGCPHPSLHTLTSPHLSSWAAHLRAARPHLRGRSGLGGAGRGRCPSPTS